MLQSDDTFPAARSLTLSRARQPATEGYGSVGHEPSKGGGGTERGRQRRANSGADSTHKIRFRDEQDYLDEKRVRHGRYEWIV